MLKLRFLHFVILLILCIRLDVYSQFIQSNYFQSFDGINIYYEVSGKGDPVVLVHGFIVDGESWKETALYQDLLDAGYQVITMDMRGNGHSGKPHNPEAYENDAEAKDIIGLLDYLGIEKYDVVGYSRGSIITSRLLVLDKRIKKAILGGMGADFTNPEWPRRIMFYKALMGEPVKELEGMVKHVHDAGLDQLALAYLQKAQPSTSKEQLAHYIQPVLVISGTEDSENGSSEELAGLIPHSQFEHVPGNHGEAVKTKEFSNAVLAFLIK